MTKKLKKFSKALEEYNECKGNLKYVDALLEDLRKSPVLSRLNTFGQYPHLKDEEDSVSKKYKKAYDLYIEIFKIVEDRREDLLNKMSELGAIDVWLSKKED